MKTQADPLNYKFGLDTEDSLALPSSPSTSFSQLILPAQLPTLTALASTAAAPILPAVEEKIEAVGKFRESLSTKLPRVTIPEPFIPKPVTISSGSVASELVQVRAATSNAKTPAVSRTERLEAVVPTRKSPTPSAKTQNADDQAAIDKMSMSLKLGGQALIVTLVIGCLLIGAQKVVEYKPAAMMQMANCAASVGAYPMAIATFDDNFNDKKHLNVLIEWASASNSRRHYDAAMVYLNKAIELDPQSAVAYNNRGCTQVSLGKFKSAIADFTEAIALEPDSVRYWMNRANCYAQMKQYKLALQNYDFAVSHGNKLAVEQRTQVVKLMKAAPRTKTVVRSAHTKVVH